MTDSIGCKPPERMINSNLSTSIFLHPFTEHYL